MISASAPSGLTDARCDGCGGHKGAPIAALVDFGAGDISLVLCEECGRDAANAIGFMCIREGGWSKLESRKRKAVRS